MSDPVRVTDHALVRYLERVVGLDVEALRADIAASCDRALRGDEASAPCVATEKARYLICGRNVVTVLDGRTVPHFNTLARLVRANARDGK